MSAELEIDIDVEWSPKQWLALTHRSPPHPETGEPQVDVVGFFGDYGGGKTWAALARFLACCLSNSFEHGVHSGDAPPLSGLVAPTLGDLKKGPLVELKKFLGPAADDIIMRERLYGEYQDIDLVNGHRILLYSAGGAMNGPTLCQMMADEVQESIFEGRWDNYQGRVRDRRAAWLNVQATGIAERSHAEALFRLSRPHPSGLPFCTLDETGSRLTVLLFPEDNEVNLGAGVIAQKRAMLPNSRRRDKDGWLVNEGAVYSTFSRLHNVRMPPGMEGLERDDLLDRPTSVSVDFGRHAAVAFGQPIRLPRLRHDPRGLLLVDQHMPVEHQDAEELADWLKRQDWRIDRKGGSVICLDPTAEPDQVRHFRRAFPGVPIRQWHRGFYHKEANGIRAVDRAVEDLNHERRLYVAPWLERDSSGRGIVQMFGGYMLKKLKDQWYEHAADVVRYLTQYWVPLPEVASAMSREAEEALSRVKPLGARVRVSDLG